VKRTRTTEGVEHLGGWKGQDPDPGLWNKLKDLSDAIALLVDEGAAARRRGAVDNPLTDATATRMGPSTTTTSATTAASSAKEAEIATVRFRVAEVDPVNWRSLFLSLDLGLGLSAPRSRQQQFRLPDRRENLLTRPEKTFRSIEVI
jgi:hypothetical protein